MAVTLLEWVCTSAFLILAVLALRAVLGGRVSARLRYALWAVVLVRLLVPVQLFTSPLAGTRVLTEKRTSQNVASWPLPSHSPDEQEILDSLGGQDEPSAALSNFPQAPNPPALPEAPEPPAAPDLTKAPAWLGWAWLAGSVAVAFVLLMSNLRFYWRLRRVRVPLEGTDCPLRVYAAVGLPSPCLFGIFRPAVYATLEAAENPDMLRHVLAHEYTHYRHGDHIWSLLRCAALAAHWWNPLAWLSARLSRRDGELACDEGALKRLGDGERAGYGSTLLALVTAKPRPGDLFRCATTMAGDKKSLKERISRIACTPKRWLWAAVAAVLATALACVCAFGQVAEPEEQPDNVDKFTPAYRMNGDRNVLIGGLNGAYMEWSCGTNGGALYFANGLSAYCCPGLAGEKSEGSAYWEDAGKSILHVRINVDDERIEDGAVGGFGIDFTVDLNGDIFTRKEFISELGDRTIEIANQEMLDMAHLLAKLLTEAEAYYIQEGVADSLEEPLTDEWVEHRVLLFQYPDLNRDGVPETIATSPFEDGTGMRVGVWQGADVGNYDAEWWDNAGLLWTDEGHNAHAGWNAVFLCTLDGEDYLLRYHPYMGQGWCDYSYELFTLENGGETLVRGNAVSFDINFGPAPVNFDPKTINAFMDEINGLLAHSVQLINTDADLFDTFAESGRLEDTLRWLDWWEPEFVRDENASLLENLLAYQEAMTPPEVRPADMESDELILTYKGKETRFRSPWRHWFEDDVEIGIVTDLDRDGNSEIVVILRMEGGTGAWADGLYLFDAGTLEQYDTSGLTEMILSSIESTGDGENYYLSAPGMERVSISRREAQEKNEYVPLGDALNLGDIVEYSLQADGVHCRLGCDASDMLLNYIGWLDVALGYSAGGGFRCVSAQYTAYTAE